MIMRTCAFVTTIATILLIVTGTFATVPNQINFQGTLTDSTGSPITDTRLMVFSIYDQESGGSLLWAETHTSVDVADGIFHVMLGSVTPVPSSIFTGTTLWLETTVEGQTLDPRTELATIPYGFKSFDADHATTADSASHAIHAETADYATESGLAAHATHSDTATWAIGVGAITHADTADYAFEAGTASTANEADHSVYSDTASWALGFEEITHVDTADYSLQSENASSATTAGHAATSDTADWAWHTPEITRVDTANYALLAESANTASSCDHADSANFATLAGSSNNATYADTAGYAFSIEEITRVDTADVALHATTAGHASTADHSTTSDTADFARNFPEITRVDSADFATLAESSNNAAYADTAGYAFSIEEITRVDTADVALHATTASSASTADHSTTSDTADFARNFPEITRVDTADYAETAGSVDHAATSDTADYAHEAGTAATATDANHAVYADTAMVAFETQSISYVDTADYALEAGYAFETDYAYYADEAYTSTEAEHAVNADTAQYAAVSMPDADWSVNADTIYHLNGNVGIGTANPDDKLDVNGTVKMTGFQLTGTRSAGDVLTSDANGVGTWQPVSGGGFSLPYEDSVSYAGKAFWIRNVSSNYNAISVFGENALSGNYGYLGHPTRGVYGISDNGHAVEGYSSSGFAGYFTGKMYASGNVGIGTETPGSKLHLYKSSGSPKLKIESDDGAPMIELDGTNDVGVYEVTFKESGTFKSSIGWESVDDYFYIEEGGGTSLASKNRNIGIGTTDPSEKLDVNGTAKLTGFKMPTGASNGYVLTSDGSGTGTWQPGGGGGFSLPYSGSDTTDAASFQVTNTSTGGSGVGVKGVGANGAYGYLGGDSVGVYGYEGTSPGLDYAGYFDGYVKITDYLSVQDGGSFSYDNSFGQTLSAYNADSNGKSFRASNASGTYVELAAGSYALEAESNYGTRAELGTYNAGVKGYAPAPDHAGYFSGDVYVSSELGIGTLTPEQQLDVYGDTYIGGGSTAHDGLDEVLRIRGMSDDWTIGVTNEASAGATDFYIGTSGEDGKFHIENGGDVGIGTNNPTAKLDVSGDVKLGASGSIFLEIQEITGTTSSSGSNTLVSYPSGYTWTNTRVLSLEIQRGGYEWIGLGNEIAGSWFSYSLNTNEIWITYANDSSLQSKPFRMILMKMP